jgi:hypothetical protein
MNVQPNLKEEVEQENPEYLKQVRNLPCCVCAGYGEVQMSPTTAHHPIHGRYSGAKRPDIMAIPLCDGHHQGTFDRSKTAIHRGKETWAKLYGPDTDYIATTQDALEG